MPQGCFVMGVHRRILSCPEKVKARQGFRKKGLDVFVPRALGELETEAQSQR